MRALVRGGQIEVAGGGWVQHEEGVTNVEALLDNFTRGHRFLAEELGVSPRSAWQLDSAAHSVGSAALQRRTGLHSLFFGRASWDALSEMRDAAALGFEWSLDGEGGAALPGAERVFAHASFGGDYGPPEGFDFDLTFGSAPPGEGEVRRRQDG